MSTTETLSRQSRESQDSRPSVRPAKQPLIWAVVAAALAVGVAVVHVMDQGGVTALAAPPQWLGWAYRLLEVGAIAVALGLVSRIAERFSWWCALLVGVGPFVGYVLSRTVGLPGDSDDKGNWSEPKGIASLIIEALLIVVAVRSIRSLRSAGSADPS
ncbi:MAG TPA: hypothetical protein VHW92_13430 [Mycobacteriales bacterium]|nr:hypothetical protein [Mycobacteriales bacterium]